jgi:DNA-3-methyladenine glycosylase
MYGPPAHAYVYFCYGNHFLFNIVTEKEGTAGAVLIRALEPVSGTGTMKKLRNNNEIINLTSGPGKLTQAMAIDKKHNGLPLLKGEIYLAEGTKKKFRISSGPRIGIKEGLHLNWRFWITDNEFVSV